MAENVRNVEQILRELFDGRDAALEKYAKVRHTQYEMNLWQQHHLPLREVDGQAKAYFSKRFLGGERITEASKATPKIKKGLESLDHAVNDGCHGRCERLVKELNEALKRLNLKPIAEIEKFLNWLTFDYQSVRNYDGDVAKEYGFAVLLFHDKENRRDFWNELKPFLKMSKMLSMQDICRCVVMKRKAVRFSKEGS